MTKSISKRRSFSLIEVVIAMSLICIGILPLASNFFDSYKQSKKLFMGNEALEKLTERMNALLSLDFEENFWLEDGKDSVEYKSGEGVTEPMKQILAKPKSAVYSDVEYEFLLKIQNVPQTYYGYGITGKEVIKESKNFVQLRLTISYKNPDKKDRKLAICSRIGQRSL